MPLLPPASHWLGEALHTARTLRRYPIVDTAKGSGVPTARLIAIERGNAVPTPAEFWAVWSFLTSDPPPFSPEPQP